MFDMNMKYSRSINQQAKKATHIQESAATVVYEAWSTALRICEGKERIKNQRLGNGDVNIGTQTCCTEFNSKNLCTDVEDTSGSLTRP
jgi:hypothetical protein